MDVEVPPSWPLRSLTLKVLDLERQSDYYKRFGLAPLRSDAEEAVFGFGATEVLRLRKLGAGGRPRPPRTAGLYHFALLLPSEAGLGGFIRHLAETRIELDGASDHGVSQALYLSDPEENGVEVYADRPASSWQWTGDRVNMVTEYLDFATVLAGADRWSGFPAESRLGHMHLTSGDVDGSFSYYNRNLGVDLTAALGPFRFASWNRYHHHFGINYLNGPGAAPVEEGVAGLESFVIERPGPPPETLIDPDGIRILSK